MRNTSVKLFCIWTNGSEGDVVERYFLSRALTALLFSRANLVMGDCQTVGIRRCYGRTTEAGLRRITAFILGELQISVF